VHGRVRPVAPARPGPYSDAPFTQAGTEMADAPVSDAECSEAAGVAAIQTDAALGGCNTMSGEP
jgi:hypothetical protein